MADGVRQTCAHCLKSLPQKQNFSGADLNNIEGRCNGCKEQTKAEKAAEEEKKNGGVRTGWSKLHLDHELKWMYASDHKRFACAKCAKFWNGKSWYCEECKFNLCKDCFQGSESDKPLEAPRPAFFSSSSASSPNRAEYHSLDSSLMSHRREPRPPGDDGQDSPPPQLPKSRLRSVPLQRGEVGWVPDANVRRCHTCRKSFGLILRKHHCRWCGLIFCKDCSNNFYGPEQTIRSCDACFKIKLEEEPKQAAQFGRAAAAASSPAWQQ